MRLYRTQSGVLVPAGPRLVRPNKPRGGDVVADFALTAHAFASTGANLSAYNVGGAFVPSGDVLVMVDVVNQTVGPSEAPSGIVGKGMTWVLETSVPYATVFNVSRWRGTAPSPTDAQMVVSFTTGQTNFAASVYEVSGVDLSGDDAENALGAVDIDSGSGTAVSLSLTAPAGTLVVMASAGAAMTSDADYIGIHSVSAGNRELHTDYDFGGETTYDGTLISGDFVGIMHELVGA